MDYRQKATLRDWELKQRYVMPQGGKMTLSFIIEEERKRANNNPTEFAMPEFLDTIHVCLYPLFVIDWCKIGTKRIPAKFRGDGTLFLRDVMSDWLDVCNKKSYFNDGMLTCFDNIQQIKEIIAQLTDKNMKYVDEKGVASIDYVQMECRMYEIQQQIVDKRKLDDLAAQEQRVLEETARRKREEAERKAAKKKAAADAAVGRDTSAAVDRLMIEAQQLFDQSPLPKVILQLYVRIADPSEPYTAELVWDNTGKAKKDQRPSDIFTGKSFADVIAKAKIHVSGLIDQLIDEQQKEKQRQTIQRQIDDQNIAFQKQMEENRRMIEQMQQLMREQQQKHEESVSQLQQQLITFNS